MVKEGNVPWVIKSELVPVYFEKEKNDLGVKVTDFAASVAVREREVADLDTLMHELEVSSSRLQEKVTVYEDCMGQLEKFQDDRMKEVNDKFYKLYANFIEMALHLEERFYPHLLTTISGHRWLLTQGVELAITKCLNSPEFLSALEAAISKSIEKGMQDGLSAGITHGKEDVSSIHVQNIKENIANQRSVLHDVFVPLSEPFSAAVLTNTEGTSDIMPATADTTMALSKTFASASTIAPISVDDYEVVGTDDQGRVLMGMRSPFPMLMMWN
ncbi:hypothetical protein Tco_1229979 [Tanacetum coccineum]